MLHHPHDLLSLPYPAWSRWGVKELFHPSPTLATLSAIDDAIDIWTGKVHEIQNSEPRHRRGTLAYGGMASSLIALPT